MYINFNESREKKKKENQRKRLMNEIAKELFKKQMSREDSKLAAQLLHSWLIYFSQRKSNAHPLKHSEIWKVKKYLQKSNMC